MRLFPRGKSTLSPAYFLGAGIHLKFHPECPPDVMCSGLHLNRIAEPHERQNLFNNARDMAAWAMVFPAGDCGTPVRVNTWLGSVAIAEDSAPIRCPTHWLLSEMAGITGEGCRGQLPRFGGRGGGMISLWPPRKYPHRYPGVVRRHTPACLPDSRKPIQSGEWLPVWTRRQGID